ncbi:MAG: NFACT RNA binding domain-containing protein [Oscillospiraceae bacterium]|nr:NFACT RNA binding domain-containing protein [Oscillospiraceae bacterium]
MALDGAYLYLVKKELEFLIGSRVDKIHQLSRDQLIISFRYKGGSSKLMFCASADSARVHITDVSIDNPAVPPMFCMLMRKHLCGGRLVNIRQDGLERILFFDFDCTSELGDPVKMTLVIEIMGKYSNIILLAQNGCVIDSIKRVDAGMSRARLILPGIEYKMPPRNERLSFLTASRDEILHSLSEQGKGELSKVLIRVFEGISPVVAREWAYYTTRGNDTDISQMSDELSDRLVFIIMHTKEQILKNQPDYNVLKTRDNILKDFTFIKVMQYGPAMVSSQMMSACAALDYFYAARDNDSRIKQRANDLFRLLLNTSERISKRTANQKEELILCADKDKKKLMGDILSANIYRISKGDKCLVTENFYDENLSQIEIPLDIKLTPSQNIQKYYHDYKKAVTAEKVLTQQILRGENEIKYIDSVFDSLTRAKSDTDIIELRVELAEQGYIKSYKIKGKLPKEQPPLRFRSSDGFEILVGRNNKQNDKLTLKTAQKTDIWFHVHDITGAHVILLTCGGEPTQTAVREAAQIAAFHSKGRNSSQVPVDYTQARYVKKPTGAKPGMVIFTNNSTVYVTPDETAVNSLSI